MAEEQKPEKEEGKPAEDWMQKKWRPMMGWQYMFVCVFDFVVFPIMFTIVQFWETQAANDAFRQWIPLTLSNGGLYHLAMGAVLGITAWSRGQEKMAGVNTSSTTSSMGMSVGGGMGGGMMTNSSSNNMTMTRTYDTVTPIMPSQSSPSYMTSTPRQNSGPGAPNLERMRQADPDNVFERG